ncbi:MAG: hypothetical protein ACTSSH_05065 [Candidatus Heimdallarchaeota archaeon]
MFSSDPHFAFILLIITLASFSKPVSTMINLPFAFGKTKTGTLNNPRPRTPKQSRC